MKTKRSRMLMIVLVVIVLAVAACTCAGPNTVEGEPNPAGHVSGFWDGLFHGFIAPFSFLVSLFDDNITMYAVHNNGNWYDLGFVLGAGILFGGGGGSASASSRRS